MEIILIPAVAFLAAILTFFSGFGLGTILTPVLMVFFPTEIAIGLTGIVHFSNNIFKLFLVGRKADKTVLIRFGIPAVIAAFAGAWLLVLIPDVKPLFSYELFDRKFEVYPVKFIISILLMIFALMDLVPLLNKIGFEKRHMPLGGILSGFFGGLSGNQGALRSAFLIRSGLSKEVFIGTTVVISSFVDFTRLSVYATKLSWKDVSDNSILIIVSTLTAITGAFLGNILLKKITLKLVQNIVAMMLLLLSVALAGGLI